MPPIYDDYNDRYCVDFPPTTIIENDYAYVESNNSFMHVDYDKNGLCIVILWNLFMMLLKVIMREEIMVVGIFMLLKHLSLC